MMSKEQIQKEIAECNVYYNECQEKKLHDSAMYWFYRSITLREVLNGKSDN